MSLITTAFDTQLRTVGDVVTVDLAGAWDKMWSAIQLVTGEEVTTLLTFIGAVLVIFAIGKFIFDKRRGGGATSGLTAVIWTLVAGALLAAPNLIIPLALTLLDWIINAIVKIVDSAK
jgi:hypothetical protein